MLLSAVAIIMIFYNKNNVIKQEIKIIDITESEFHNSNEQLKSTAVDIINADSALSESEKENFIQNGKFYSIFLSIVEEVDDFENNFNISFLKHLVIFSDKNNYIIPKNQDLFEEQDPKGIEIPQQYEVFINWYSVGHQDYDMKFDSIYPANEAIRLVWGLNIQDMETSEINNKKYFYEIEVPFNEIA